MKKLVLAAVLAAISFSTVSAQLRYAVTGAYQKMPGQGMAIWGENAYLFNQTGYCRIFNFKSESVTAEFRLASSYEKNHANSVSFGTEIPEGSEVPALYITEFNGKYRCFVEKVVAGPSTDAQSQTGNSSGQGGQPGSQSETTDASQAVHSELIQTIEFAEKGKNAKIVDWVVDRDNGALYITYVNDKKLKETGEQEIVITKLPLPLLSDGSEVTLTENDILDRFTVTFANGLQGATIRSGKLYIVTGMQESSYDQDGHERAVKVIDLKKRELAKSVDLTTITVNAPQDLDFYGGKAFLFCGQNGGLYQVKL